MAESSSSSHVVKVEKEYSGASSDETEDAANSDLSLEDSSGEELEGGSSSESVHEPDKQYRNVSHPLSCWTQEEKFALYTYMKASFLKHSKKSKSPHAIQKSIPTKSIDEITEALEYYKNQAMTTITRHKQRKIRAHHDKFKASPLIAWAQMLMDTLSPAELHTEFIPALRLIAEFERLPEPHETDGVDYRALYHRLADIMEGKPVVPNRLIDKLLHNCVSELILASKTFIHQNTFMRIVKTFDLVDNKLTGFAQPTNDIELANLRHLNVQRKYNPFNIAEEYLEIKKQLEDSDKYSDESA